MCLTLQPIGLTHQALLSMEFSRQEYWNRLPFPSSGELPDPKIESASPALAGRLFTTEPPGRRVERLFIMNTFMLIIQIYQLLTFCHVCHFQSCHFRVCHLSTVVYIDDDTAILTFLAKLTAICQYHLMAQSVLKFQLSQKHVFMVAFLKSGSREGPYIAFGHVS